MAVGHQTRFMGWLFTGQVAAARLMLCERATKWCERRQHDGLRWVLLREREWFCVRWCCCLCLPETDAATYLRTTSGIGAVGCCRVGVEPAPWGDTVGVRCHAFKQPTIRIACSEGNGDLCGELSQACAIAWRCLGLFTWQAVLGRGEARLDP